MTIIPNFPEALLTEHRRWHRARHSVDPDRPPVGYGLDFLMFHRQFVAKVLDWYRRAGLDPRLVEPWPSVPEPIRQARCYNLQAEARILLRPDTFATADELGRYLESSGIHGCIHVVAADLFGDPEIDDMDLAPRNTVFYNIHRMIDNWWRNWEGLGRFGEGMAYWNGRFHESDEEVLHYRREDSTWWLGKPERFGPPGSLPRAAGEAGKGTAADEGATADVGAAAEGPAGANSAAKGVASEAAAVANFTTINAAANSAASLDAVAEGTAAVNSAASGFAGEAGLHLDWGAVGESAAFGRLDDGRPFRVWDADKDGRLEIVFQSPFTGDWWEGALRTGRLVWSQIRLERTGLPAQEPDSLRPASSRRKRKTRK